MRLITTSYTGQEIGLPKIGRYILAQFDDEGDPDHSPTGGKLARKAIQLGLRGEMLELYAREWIIWVEDISAFVYEQYQNLVDFDKLIVPSEMIYPVTAPKIAAQLQLSGEAIDPDR